MLPEEYRPAQPQRLAMSYQCTTDRFTGNYLGRLTIGKDGNCSIQNLGPNATNAPFYLDGIRFALDLPAYTMAAPYNQPPYMP